ncbi:MAG: 4Fe-4S binding protein [Candidatus Aureabacteria bacterium]|nr:4Fe-4S binding protein [Candidatus Auribacterota bacterium]
MKRKIIEIDENKCTGCGLCIPGCAEGALRIIDGKARLMSDLCCDGLGACIGHCPEGAIRIGEREVKEGRVSQRDGVSACERADRCEIAESMNYSEKMHTLTHQADATEGKNRASEWHGCPGAKVADVETTRTNHPGIRRGLASGSQLTHWPVQIRLVPPSAPFLKGADLLIAADCVPFAYAGFHDEMLRGKALLVGCPKFDDASLYLEKITQILKANDIRSVTVARMEVPCCYGLVKIARDALRASGKKIDLHEVEIGIKGDIQ